MLTFRAVLEWMLRHPFTYAALLLAFAATVATRSWLIGVWLLVILEPAVYLYLLASQDQRRRAAHRLEGKRREQWLERLPEIAAELHPEVRTKLTTVIRDCSRLCDQLSSPHSEASMKTFLGEIEHKVDSVSEAAVRLANRQHLMLQFLDQTDPREIERIIERLEKKSGHDGEAALPDAMALRKRQLEHLASIREASDRIDRQWLQIDAALSELRARVVRLQGAETGDRALARQSVAQEIDALTTQIDSLEKSIQEVLAV